MKRLHGMRNADQWTDLRDALSQALLNLAQEVPLHRLGWKSKLHVLFSFIPLNPSNHGRGGGVSPESRIPFEGGSSKSRMDSDEANHERP